ncbi:class I SAM-dependent methyltransferase [Lachnospiraceae bacterium 54-53]
MKLNLGEVQETMLIPLAVKASETLRPNARIRDEKALHMIKSLRIDAAKYDKFMSHEGVVARTIMFDREVKSYLAQFPDAVCINLGCGLDDRFSRVDNGKILWYDIDLPDALVIRKHFFENRKRVTMIAGSVLEPDWAGQVEKGRKAVIIAEGLFMYFKQEEVKKLLSIITGHFPDCVIIAELMPPIAAKGSKHHDTVKHTKASFQWGTKSGHELEPLCPGLKLVKEESFNVVMKTFTIRGRLFSLIPGIRDCNDRLAVFEWNLK